MFTYIQNIENRLSDDQKDALKRIYEPTVTEIPLSDARRDICILPDGEIRSYGKLYASGHFANDGKVAYLSSVDGGLSWKREFSYGKMNSCTYIERAGIYVTAVDKYINNSGIEGGLFVYRSEIGPDDPDPEIIKLSDEIYGDTFLPQQSAFGNRIWFTSQCEGKPEFFFSDDFGKSWERRKLPLPYEFETVFPHKGLRWCKFSGSEPYAVELSENKLMLLIRTPSDCFYKSYSYDGGDSWSKPEPSTFYGTNTTPFMLRMSDGRIITFWNNTKPLSQPNTRAVLPYAGDVVVNGTGENAFTNRDVAHAAISDDGGESFSGYREILLNPERNSADFRYKSGVASSADKSVHQFQAYELPFNKILVSAGQNKCSRRIVIFDADWLKETSRKEDFLRGMENITVHTYLKSVSGSHYGYVGNGHCAWNRTYAAYPMPDPDGGYAETLYISKHSDDRLVNNIGGMGWNFPLSKQGSVSVELKLTEKQARFILTDRWYNVCDPYAAVLSPFWFELDAADVGDGFVRVDIAYDTEKGEALVFIADELFFKVKMTAECPTGICYLILQCATDGDSKGFYVKALEKNNGV